MTTNQTRPRDRRQMLKDVATAGAGAVLATGVLSSWDSKAAAATAEFDVVVVGSGAAGMTAALTAAHKGLSVVVIEKAKTFGGSTARSGAGIWIRNNEVILNEGVPDSPEKAAAYLARVVGPQVSAERQAAFLDYGPAMLSFVMKNTPLKFRWMEGYSDYYPELPGGIAMGCSVEPDQVDGKLLGDELANLTPPYLKVPEGVVIFGGDYKWLNMAAVSAKGVAVAAKAAARYAAAKARGEKPLTMGQALAAGLRVGLLKANVPVWLNTPLVDIDFDETGRAAGVIATRNGVRTLIKARRGVIMGSGGFEHNLAMRQRYQPQPTSTEWTVGAASNTGDGIQAGQRAGAAVDLMDDSWWGPVIPLPDGPYFVLSERSMPGSLIVNGEGQRFVNEAAPYTDFVHTMYEKDRNGSHIPAWLIVDQHYRNRYLFKVLPPLAPLPPSWLKSGAAHRGWTLKALAKDIGVPPEALKATVKRFNGFAKTGKDLDFKRGDSAYDHYYTDPDIEPNSCLAPLRVPPFYAFKILPGDLGTKGGLKTDAQARVLTVDGDVIPGLYAAGNCSAAVMGRSYAGAGATLGPAMTFGYIAALDITAST